MTDYGWDFINAVMEVIRYLKSTKNLASNFYLHQPSGTLQTMLIQHHRPNRNGRIEKVKRKGDASAVFKMLREISESKMDILEEKRWIKKIYEEHMDENSEVFYC